MTVTDQPRVPRHARAASPWQGIARDAAREWFRENPGAPLAEFDRWAVETWEPDEFLRAGCGWRPGQPVNVAAFTAARRGLREAMEDEQRRRAARHPRQDGVRSPLGRPVGRGASAGTNLWWEAS